MSERYTRKDAERALERLAEATGHRIATSYSDVGGWTLDYAACYGGFSIEQVHNEQGAVSKPFGERRYPAREFCEMVQFALYAVGQAQR
jgi:galactokinase/mevalonate kinase-like predicted kinase